MYGGTIQVESIPGKGFTFGILIPFEVYEGEALVKSESVSPDRLRKDLKGITVLLVEDIESG